MKFVFCLLVVLPLALCRSVDERFIVDSFKGLSLHDVTDALVAALGSDTSEAACEAGCPSIIGAIPGGSLVSGFLCTPACKEVQHLVQQG